MLVNPFANHPVLLLIWIGISLFGGFFPQYLAPKHYRASEIDFSWLVSGLGAPVLLTAHLTLPCISQNLLGWTYLAGMSLVILLSSKIPIQRQPTLRP